MVYTLKGIYGGTFNPIHYGHLRMAQEIAEGVALDEVKFIPSANPPHKAQPKVTAEQRAEMVAMAIEGNDLFTLDKRELERDKPSFTLDTVKSLYQEEEKTAFCLMMGSDAFMQFDTWHEWEKIIDYCHIILVHRPNSGNQQGLNQNLEVFMRDHYTENTSELSTVRNGLMTMQSITALDISSTNIRKIQAQGFDPTYLTPTTIIDYIGQNNFYQE